MPATNKTAVTTLSERKPDPQQFYDLRSSQHDKMIFPITSENDLLMMDEKDYSEHMLLSPFEDKPLGNSCHTSTTIEGSVSTLLEEDAMDESEFLNSDSVVPGDSSDTEESCPDKTEETVVAEVEEPEETVSAKVEDTEDDVALEAQESVSVKAEPQDESEISNDPEASSDVSVPSKFDILCGQSRICANHTGNRRFQVILDIYAERYDASTSKQEKMTSTKEIVACIKESGGRFLKYQDGLWVEIPDVTARDKVSHALRTKVASWKRQKALAEQEKAEKSSSSPSKSSKPKPTHRRKAPRRRRSSSNSIATSASDIATSSFDASNSATSSVMELLLKNQREIFASLTQSEHGETHPLKKEKETAQT